MTVGYSGTPLAKKIGIKEEMTVVAVATPDNYTELLGLVDIKTCAVDEKWPGLKPVIRKENRQL